jgi:O-succinylbenzoic acid--CoA ligase
MLLPDWLARRAALHPGRPALLVADAAWSFAELDAWASAVAARLAALGVAPGDRVALLARNTPAYVAAVHAAPRAGVILVPLNARLAPAELAWQLADCGASLLLFDAPHAQLAAGLLVTRGQGDKGTGGIPQFASLEQIASPPPLVPPSPCPPLPLSPPPLVPLDSPHTIIYTSGTTGRPKGAILTAGNHWWSATASALNLGLRDDDRWLAVLPLFHVGGLSILLRGAIYGIPVVLHERFDPAAALRAIEEQGVTIASVVAVMLQRILDAAGDRPLPAHFRCALLGGGPAPLPLLEACAARGVPVVQTYGMTETASQAATLAPADALRKLGSAGQPLLPVELRIEAHGRAAAPGEVGEICVRGPTVTAGYYGRPDATADAIRDGWLYTGDLGHLDAEGYLYVVDRRSDLIISGGENVYPAEVEAALLAHPAVLEAGVVGAPDPTWGQVPVAYVVARPGHAAGPELAAELLAFTRERLAAYKQPRRVTVVASLPRTASGKLRRTELKQNPPPAAEGGA